MDADAARGGERGARWGDFQAGDLVPLPCRHCGRTLISFAMKDGAHDVRCARCGRATRATVYREGERWRVKTERA